jgi:hypothetical protein
MGVGDLRRVVGAGLAAQCEPGRASPRAVVTILVDELSVWPGAKARCFNGGSCHLTYRAPSTEEDLHAFAAKLGLRRSWFQRHRVADHYDLTAGKREKALALGAVFETGREQIVRRRAARASATPT